MSNLVHVLCLTWILLKGNVFSLSFKLFSLYRTIDRSVFKPIVQISVIDRSESSDCHLLAVTHAGKDLQDRREDKQQLWVMCRLKWNVYALPAGVRLYFSTTPFVPLHQKHVAIRPSLLALVHVRLPPGFSASSTLQKPAKVHKALHSKGKFYCIFSALFPPTPLSLIQVKLFVICTAKSSLYYSALYIYIRNQCLQE